MAIPIPKQLTAAMRVDSGVVCRHICIHTMETGIIWMAHMWQLIVARNIRFPSIIMQARQLPVYMDRHTRNGQLQTMACGRLISDVWQHEMV